MQGLQKSFANLVTIVCVWKEIVQFQIRLEISSYTLHAKVGGNSQIL